MIFILFNFLLLGGIMHAGMYAEETHSNQMINIILLIAM